MKPRLLIAGIGNIFLGDDGFGCEVAQQLAQLNWPDDVRVVDFGIRGLDLAYALTEDLKVAILIDAMSRGDRPGTLYTLELDPAEAGETVSNLDAHSMHPLNVLRLVQTLGGTRTRILLLGCEPESLGEETDGHIGLSPVIRNAVESALPLVQSLVADELRKLGSQSAALSAATGDQP